MITKGISLPSVSEGVLSDHEQGQRTHRNQYTHRIH